MTFIAQNQVKPAEVAIATFRRNVYLSEDQRLTWNEIAKEGQTL